MIDKFTLQFNETTGADSLSCLEPGWCDYKTKTIHLDHVSAVSFTVSFDCPLGAKADQPPLLLSVHTSTAGMAYDSIPVSLESQGKSKRLFASSRLSAEKKTRTHAGMYSRVRALLLGIPTCGSGIEAAQGMTPLCLDCSAGGSCGSLRFAPPDFDQCVSGSPTNKRWQVTTDALKLPGRFAKVQLATEGFFANISVVATLIGV